MLYPQIPPRDAMLLQRKQETLILSIRSSLQFMDCMLLWKARGSNNCLMTVSSFSSKVNKLHIDINTVPFSNYLPHACICRHTSTHTYIYVYATHTDTFSFLFIFIFCSKAFSFLSNLLFVLSLFYLFSIFSNSFFAHLQFPTTTKLQNLS